jgi:hypothetical protein
VRAGRRCPTFPAFANPDPELFSLFAKTASCLARISHTASSRDAARNRARKARTGFPAGLYENILSKGNSGRNEAGAGRSSRSEVETACSQSSPQGAEGGNSQQKRYEKCGLAAPILTIFC